MSPYAGVLEIFDILIPRLKKPIMTTSIDTYCGIDFHPFNPVPSMVVIEDIAHALSNLCRFSGHCREFYSVAQHSVLVSSILPQEHKLPGLLHDGSEAYLQDICSPIKKSPEFKMYRELEANVEAVIAQKFGYAFPLDPRVKEADLILLATEMRDLMPYPLAKPAPPLKETIVPMSPKEAKAAFLQAYYNIRHKENEDFRG